MRANRSSSRNSGNATTGGSAAYKITGRTASAGEWGRGTSAQQQESSSSLGCPHYVLTFCCVHCSLSQDLESAGAGAGGADRGPAGVSAPVGRQRGRGVVAAAPPAQ